jgi:hypothetical protein
MPSSQRQAESVINKAPNESFKLQESIRRNYYRAVFTGCLLSNEEGSLEINFAVIAKDMTLARVFKNEANTLSRDLASAIKVSNGLAACAKDWGCRINHALSGSQETKAQWERLERDGLAKNLIKSYMGGLMAALIAGALPDKTESLKKMARELDEYYENNKIEMNLAKTRSV